MWTGFREVSQPLAKTDVEPPPFPETSIATNIPREQVIIDIQLTSRQARARIGFWASCLTFILFASATVLSPPMNAQQVTQLPKGTVIADRPPAGWTDTLFVSVPRVSDGDIDKVSSMVVEYAEMLSLVIVAKKVQDTDTGAYRLSDIGIGLAVRRAENLVVVSGPASNLPVPTFDFMSGAIINSAAKSLDEMQVIARRTTLIIYDSPAIFRRGQKNVQLTMRSLVWLSPSTGQIGQLVWLLDLTDGTYSPAINQACYLQPPFVEQRAMYVDAREFNLIGVPNTQAFALTQLPLGKKIEIDNSLVSLVSLKTYTVDQLGALANGLTRLLQK